MVITKKRTMVEIRRMTFERVEMVGANFSLSVLIGRVTGTRYKGVVHWRPSLLNEMIYLKDR